MGVGGGSSVLDTVGIVDAMVGMAIDMLYWGRC